MLIIIAVLCPDTDVTNFIPVTIPSGHDTKLTVYIPSRGQVALTTPDMVYENVASTWSQVVQTHQAGLVDPKVSCHYVISL